MKKKEEHPNLVDYDAVLDERYGKPGTPERDAWEKEALTFFGLHDDGKTKERGTFSIRRVPKPKSPRSLAAAI
jgi:hypothetical protein